jgi:hypothetical protein
MHTYMHIYIYLPCLSTYIFTALGDEDGEGSSDCDDDWRIGAKPKYMYAYVSVFTHIYVHTYMYVCIHKINVWLKVYDVYIYINSYV